ncbi:MAG: phosphate acetyltransferase, partial [Coriobacteriia bacterium]|nr:phosphate acetyltransferase [Coriobacteriia bacterium]
AIEGVQVIDYRSHEKLDSYAHELAQLLAHKDVSLQDAYTLLEDELYFAVMMVKMGDADGLVAGAAHSTADTLRPALRILKTKPDVKTVSGFFYMVIPNDSYGSGEYLFADCAIVENPSTEQLVEIAHESAKSFESFNDENARIAFLSYSTLGSAKGELVDKVAHAAQKFKEQYPEILADGELQLDAAIVKSVAERKAPESKLAGQANILIFPDLQSGNIAYKLTQRFAKAEAYGPILQGIAKPVNDLSRGTSVEDIIGVVAITA